MSALNPARDGVRHRRQSSQKLNPFPKLAFPAGSNGDTPSTFSPSPLSPRRSALGSSPSGVSRKTREPVPTGWRLGKSEWDLLIFSTMLKVLLFPAYRSTDFEVHRNWLAITYSLPMSKWYWDTTSEWTLDYPPFFAYFEFLLSLPARLVDKRIVDLTNLNYSSWSVIAYQRSTVIVTELVLGAALIRLSRASLDRTTQRIIAFSLFLHPGFIIVDHIHFQYNGFLFGILVWSILMAREGRWLLSATLFAVLLNFKHIYMYLAPAYFVYLLRAHVLPPPAPTPAASSSTPTPISTTAPSSLHTIAPPPSHTSSSNNSSGGTFAIGSIKLANLISLANAVVAIFVLSFGPFVFLKSPPEYGADHGQIKQILSRLFPFKRGLNHAYWAPNLWALVTFLDRVGLKVVQLLHLPITPNPLALSSSSRGLIGDTHLALLPTPTPLHTFILTLLLQIPFLIKLWWKPTYKSFLGAVVGCAWASFGAGWHVHEKAVLLVLVPLSLMAADSHAHLRTFVIASVAGIVSVFPLIFHPSESIFKVAYSLAWCVVVFTLLTKRVYEFPDTLLGNIIDRLERLYILGFAPLQLFVSVYGWTPGFMQTLSKAGAVEAATSVIESVTSSVLETATSSATVIEATAATMAELCTTGALGEIAASCSPPTSIPTATATPLSTASTLLASAIQASPSDIPPIAVQAATGGGNLEFLPLMLTSVYCAIGLLWAFGRFGWIYLFRS